MKKQDDDKATASLLLSTDEAVAEKIRRVLANNPDIIAEAMRKVEESLMIQKRDAEYRRALQQSMLQNQAQNAYTYQTYQTNNTNQGSAPMTFEQWLGKSK